MQKDRCQKRGKGNNYFMNTQLAGQINKLKVGEKLQVMRHRTLSLNKKKYLSCKLKIVPNYYYLQEAETHVKNNIAQ